jgi:anti-sigma regulatory factor (Ser/Thr protein kinase)
MTQTSHERYPISDPSDVGAARRAVDALAQALRMASRQTEAARLAATELGSNVLRHGQDGYLLLRPLDHRRGLEILAVDRGQGIAHPAHALDGAGATAGGLGVGLGSVQRLAGNFDLDSGVSKGTVVLGRFWTDDSGDDVAPGGSLRAGGVSLAVVPGDRNGDGWAVNWQDTGCSALVVDGLGHGPAAYEAAQAALALFDSHYDGDLCRWLHAADTAIRHTRGGVAAIARVEPSQQRVWFAGIGNIQGRVMAPGRTLGLVSQPGILGAQQQHPRIRLGDLPWMRGASLLLWSDGIRSDVALDLDPRLFSHDPAVVAATLHRDFARGTDDATIVVVSDHGGGRW